MKWMFEAHNVDVISSLLEEKTVSITIDDRSKLPLDYYSLGYCIAHSKCKWVVLLHVDIGEEEVKMLMAGASTRHKTSSRFCDDISWPNLFGIQVLNLGFWSKMNWRLDTLFAHLSLESLIISCTGNGVLVFEDCDAIGLHIKSTTCLKELCIAHCTDYLANEGIEVISEALSDNQSLPLERLKLNFYGTFTDTAADCLTQFITNTTTLQHLTICYCRFSAPGLLALVQALHQNSTLQEKSLKTLKVTVNSDNEANDFAQLLVEYPYMLDDIDNQYFYNIISDFGAVALAQALHHNCTLEDLYLSNNRISDDGAVALAQALHHNSTLEILDLSGNDGIGKEGTYQLVQALTVNTSITYHGLTLPWKCKEYATQCTQYNTVKSRIRFW